jgi:hypothetical protein
LIFLGWVEVVLFTHMVAYFSPPSTQTLLLCPEMEARKQTRTVVKATVSACSPLLASSEDGGRGSERGLQMMGVSG